MPARAPRACRGRRARAGRGSRPAGAQAAACGDGPSEDLLHDQLPFRRGLLEVAEQARERVAARLVDLELVDGVPGRVDVDAHPVGLRPDEDVEALAARVL